MLQRVLIVERVNENIADGLSREELKRDCLEDADGMGNDVNVLMKRFRDKVLDKRKAQNIALENRNDMGVDIQPIVEVALSPERIKQKKEMPVEAIHELITVIEDKIEKLDSDSAHVKDNLRKLSEQAQSVIDVVETENRIKYAIDAKADVIKDDPTLKAQIAEEAVIEKRVEVVKKLSRADKLLAKRKQENKPVELSAPPSAQEIMQESIKPKDHNLEMPKQEETSHDQQHNAVKSSAEPIKQDALNQPEELQHDTQKLEAPNHEKTSHSQQSGLDVDRLKDTVRELEDKLNSSKQNKKDKDPVVTDNLPPTPTRTPPKPTISGKGSVSQK
jgi:hypothetical protein